MLVVAFSFCLLITIILIAADSGHNYYEDYIQSPLDSTVAMDLCSKDIVSDLIEACNQADKAIKFYQVRQIMEYYLEQNYSYSEINTLFGTYLRDCTTPLNSNFYRCAYIFDDYKLDLLFNLNTDRFLRIRG